MTEELIPPLRERLVTGEPLQLVALRLAGELYACDVMAVEEVVTGERIHRLPDMPVEVLGVLSLRGSLIPVVDLASRLGLKPITVAVPSILVLRTGSVRIGVAAEDVSEVLAVEPAQVRAAPGSARDRETYILGVARMGDVILSLIDPVEILAEDTRSTTQEAP